MTRTCPDIQLLLTEFAADELDAADAADVAAHVAGCDACRDELALEMGLRRTLSTLPVRATSVGRLPRPDASARTRRWGTAVGGLVAAALALAVLVPEPEAPVPEPLIGLPYTPTQVAQARQDLRTSLSLAARIMERTERHTLTDVFGRRLPRAVAGSLAGGTTPPEGGRG